ncbi:MAG: TetR/AcrR family transcriptional regulator C-terminal domain-containing protein, partial [Neomegalonema sp.]|nr:TetR/AcrR family transcriptional regulator C-terminal domain-containing protein [Neomegalonema sp.]
VRQLLERAASRGEIEIADGAVLGELYLAALIGDLQIKRVIGVLPPLTEAEIQERAAGALASIEHLIKST